MKFNMGELERVGIEIRALHVVYPKTSNLSDVSTCLSFVALNLGLLLTSYEAC